MCGGCAGEVAAMHDGGEGARRPIRKRQGLGLEALGWMGWCSLPDIGMLRMRAGGSMQCNPCQEDVDVCMLPMLRSSVVSCRTI